MGVGGVFVTLRAFTDKFKVDMKKAGEAVNRFRTSTVNINRQLKKVGKTMSKVGRQMSTSFTLPIVAAGGLAVKTFADFEQEMAKVAAVSGATGAEFKKLEKLATDLGASTRFTASEVAALQLNYSKLGFVPAQIEKITKPTLDLALATGEDLAQSAEVAGGTLRAFGMTADQMPRLVDLMAKSFSSSALNLEKFRDSMKSAAPVANAVGATVEDTTAIMSTLVDANIDASTAGTSLRNIFLELSAKGLTWNQAMKKIKGSTDKAKTANELFGKRAVAAALVIANNTEKLDKLKKEYKNAGGSAKKMAGIMDNTLQGALLKVQSALEGAAIELGNTLAPVIKKVGEFIADLANKFSNLSPRTKKIIAVIGGLVAAIGPLLVVLGFLTSTVLPALVSGLAVLTGPIGLIVLGIVALTAGFIALASSGKNASRVQDEVNTATKEYNTLLAKEAGEANALFMQLKNTNIGSKRRKDLIVKINEKYPEFLKNQLSEKSTLIEISKAQDKVIAGIRKRIGAKISEAKQTKILTEQFERETRLLDKITESESAMKAEKFGTFLSGEAGDVGNLMKAYKALRGTSGQLREEIFKSIKMGKDAEGVTLAQVDAYAKLADEYLIIDGSSTNYGDVLVGLMANRKEDNRIIDATIKKTKQLTGAIEDVAEETKIVADITDTPLGDIGGTGGEAITDPFKGMGAGAEMSKATTELDMYEAGLAKVLVAQTRLKEQAEAVAGAVGGAFASMAAKIVESFVSAETAGGRFLGEIIKTAIQFISTAMATAIAAAIQGASIAAAFTGPAAPFTQPAFLATMVGGVLAAFASIPKLASGGLAFGETLGVIGEGSGTTKSNPEVIAPLDKLQGMLGGMGGGGGGVTEFVLRGETLRAVTNKVADNRSFTVRE